jgi:ATP phosphoribosyltransferase regulatory subunit
LLAALELPEKAAGQLRAAVNRKAEAELSALLNQTSGVLRSAAEALLALPRLAGGVEVLSDAAAHCVHPMMESALDDLRQVAALLDAYGVAGDVSYDLAEVRDLDYYTGVTYEGFAPGLGFNLISGGRYDDLIGHFGPPLPAVGWALTLDRVILARELQGVQNPESAPDLLLSAEGCPECLEWAGSARRLGLQVEVDPSSLTPDELWRVALERRIPRVVWRTETGALEVRDRLGQRALAADEWEEVSRWSSTTRD